MSTNTITLDHGSGGKMSHSLIAGTLLPFFNNPVLSRLDDGAVLDIKGTRIAFSTDSYTVDPLFFPGGDIGELAVNGTVNDVAMCGALPRFLSSGIIMEEGFPLTDLERILASMKKAAERAGVQIVTGDTKVVPKGGVDKLFINTSGIGIIPDGINVSGSNAAPGDKIILSGYIADHGVTILTKRENMSFDSPVKSDSAPLNNMVKKIIETTNKVHVFRDPTRGGVGTTLNEIVASSQVGITIYEEKIPVRNSTKGICELLGFDPLYMANEGKLLAFLPEDISDTVLSIIREDEFGNDASVIGEVTAENPGMVFMKTAIGGERIVDMLTGEQLPRIC
ncbi:MAG: hydrogenase expression/formation protein HypE [Desulfobacteraceae bacterium]|jgi:hydrogenase expression/formation protein HypE